MMGYLSSLDTAPTTDLENPTPWRPAAAEQRDTLAFGKIFGILVAAILALGILAGIIFFFYHLADTTSPPRYSVAIDSMSGLDPTTDLGRPVLHPAFNLTMRVASMSHSSNACFEAGTYVEVAYRCVTLAASATAQHQLCAGPRGAAEQRLVATGTGVRVPGPVLDSIAADMRQGAVAFQVSIRQSGGEYVDDVLVASCGGRRVGAAAADLRTRCDAYQLCPNDTKNDYGSH